MPAITLAKSGKRYTHQEWLALVDSGEAEKLLSRYGPGYTDEAWARHRGFNFDNKKSPRSSTG